MEKLKVYNTGERQSRGRGIDPHIHTQTQPKGRPSSQWYVSLLQQVNYSWTQMESSLFNVGGYTAEII